MGKEKDRFLSVPINNSLRPYTLTVLKQYGCSAPLSFRVSHRTQERADKHRLCVKLKRSIRFCLKQGSQLRLHRLPKGSAQIFPGQQADDTFAEENSLFETLPAPLLLSSRTCRTKSLTKCCMFFRVFNFSVRSVAESATVR